MNNTKYIARSLFYTGDCDYTPSEEEERELNVKYGMSFPYKNKFNKLADKYTKEQEEQEEANTQNDLIPHTRLAIADLIDEIEDEYNLDVNNLDPKKYKRLENRFEDVQKHIWKKIMMSNLPDVIRKNLAKHVERSKSVFEILMFLLFKTSKL